MTKKSLQTINSTSIVKAEDDCLSFDNILLENNLGSENVKSENLKTPFVKIAQSTSPIVKEGKDRYIEGAKPGMIYESVSQLLFDQKEGVNFIPVYFEVRFIERVNDGVNTFVADHGTNEQVIKGLNKNGYVYQFDHNDNFIAPTPTEYVLLLDEENSGIPAAIPFTSSLADQSRILNTLIANNTYPSKDGCPQMVKPSRWYKNYNLSTTLRSGKKGEWFVFKISENEPIIDINYKTKEIQDNINNGRVLYAQAMSFYKLIKEGSVDHYEDQYDVEQENQESCGM